MVKSRRGSKSGEWCVVANKLNFEGLQQELGSIVAVVVEGDCQRYSIIVRVVTRPNAPFGQRIEDHHWICMEKSSRKAIHRSPTWRADDTLH